MRARRRRGSRCTRRGGRLVVQLTSRASSLVSSTIHEYARTSDPVFLSLCAVVRLMSPPLRSERFVRLGPRRALGAARGHAAPRTTLRAELKPPQAREEIWRAAAAGPPSRGAALPRGPLPGAPAGGFGAARGSRCATLLNDPLRFLWRRKPFQRFAYPTQRLPYPALTLPSGASRHLFVGRCRRGASRRALPGAQRCVCVRRTTLPEKITP